MRDWDPLHSQSGNILIARETPLLHPGDERCPNRILMDIVAYNLQLIGSIDLSCVRMMLKQTSMTIEPFIKSAGIRRKHDPDILFEEKDIIGYNFNAKMEMRRHQTICESLGQRHDEILVFIQEIRVVFSLFKDYFIIIRTIEKMVIFSLFDVHIVSHME